MGSNSNLLPLNPPFWLKLPKGCGSLSQKGGFRGSRFELDPTNFAYLFCPIRILSNPFTFLQTTLLFLPIMAFPGTPQQGLFPIRRPFNPPPGIGARQVMSPTHNLLPVLRTSFSFVNQRIDLQRGVEEASAQRVLFEANMVFEASQREEALLRELQEIRFAEAYSLQTQPELHFWEQHERATFEARLRTAELRLCQETAQHTHNLEVNALRAHHQLRGELEEVETSYRQSVQNEAEAFAQHLRQELEYQTTSTAQAQSLLSAERRQTDIDPRRPGGEMEGGC